MNVRLFVVVEIPEEIQKKFMELQDKLKKADADVGWVAPGNFHITLKFIGAIDEEKIDAVTHRVKDAVAHINSFDISYIGIGVFPTEKNPRVLFVDVADPDKALAKIHEELDSQLMALDIEYKNRPFEAHLTLGRVKTRKNVKKLLEILDSYNSFNFGPEHVTQIVLMKSTLLPNGPAYAKLHDIHLI